MEIVKVAEAISGGDQVKVNYENGRLEQNSRNAIKMSLTNALQVDLEEAFSAVSSTTIASTEDGLGVSIATPSGTVSFVINLTIKSLDYDLEAEAEEHATKEAARQAQKAKIEARKAEKAEKDAILREKKRQERLAKEAEGK